ncbi:hypothetical protein PIB30_019243 [Stylosanthes scabra]|uniref:Uncharacterized protein n=1 Tax=Stylosanthes scabra TaxID=79078 RepID=A0ABU6R8G0_9FABA|nr:hypothetical protein [Stylosanthes scabra]
MICNKASSSVQNHYEEEGWIKVNKREKGNKGQGTKGGNTEKREPTRRKPLWAPKIVQEKNNANPKIFSVATTKFGNEMATPQLKEHANNFTPVPKGKNKRLRPLSLSPKIDDVASEETITL